MKGVGSSDLGVPGTINVSGSLALDNTSGSNGSINLSGGVSQGIIDVMPGGTLTAAGKNNLFDSCCGAGRVSWEASLFCCCPSFPLTP